MNNNDTRVRQESAIPGPEVEILPIYVADTGLPDERLWAAMIPAHERATLGDDGQFAAGDEPIRRGIIVLHKRYLDNRLSTNADRKAWRSDAAARTDGPIIVVISGYNQTPNLEGPRLYYRRLRVTAERAAPDADFAGRFAEFYRATGDALAAGQAIPFDLLDRSVGAPAVAALLEGGIGSNIFQALRTQAPADFSRLYDYGQLEHFRLLWSWLDPHAVVPNGDVFIVVETPAPLEDKHSRGLEAHLTVYDWIVALTSRAASDASFRPGLRLHVIDALPRRHPDARAFGPQSSILVAHLAPWVRLSKVKDPEHPTDADKHVIHDFEMTFLQVCVGSPASGVAAFADWAADPINRSDAETLRRLWVSDLTRAEKRHDVANAIGPTLLARSLSNKGWLSPLAADLTAPTEPADPAAYFMRLLEALGVLQLPPAAVPEKSGLSTLRAQSFVAADLFGRFGSLRFALVDDQCSAGFHDVLAAFLLQGPKGEESPAGPNAPDRFSRAWDGSLASFASPHVLLDWLEGTMMLALRDVDEGLAPRLFGKAGGFTQRTPGGDPAPFDILFLDLRLFNVVENENTWIEQLLRFAGDYRRQFLNGASFNQWAAFEAVVEAAKEQIRRPAGGVRHLALAPLLISLCDPTMPIILFSSTRQRAVIELLKPFPNVITEFAKPALTGYGDEDRASIAEAAEVLQSAVKRALRMHERRLVWEMFEGWHAQDFWAPPCVMRTRDEDKQQYDEDHARGGGRQINFGLRFPEAGEPGWQAIGQVRFAELVRVIAQFCVDEELLELAPRAAEFIEAAMRDLRTDRTARFEPVRLDNAAGGALRQPDGARARAARVVQRARNQVDHGYLFGEELDLTGLPGAVEALLILFLLSVAEPERASRLWAYVSNQTQPAGKLLHAMLYSDRHDPHRDRGATPLYSADADFFRSVLTSAARLCPDLNERLDDVAKLDASIDRHEMGQRLDGWVSAKDEGRACAYVRLAHEVTGRLAAANVPGGVRGSTWKNLGVDQRIAVWIENVDEINRNIEFTMFEPSTPDGQGGRRGRRD